MSVEEIYESLYESIEVIKETYLALLKLPICSWRINNQRIYCKLRDAIADFEGRSIQEIQEEYETKANHYN